MSFKYEKFDLKDLTFEYFVMENKIHDMTNKKLELEKEISKQYDIKRDIYSMIKLKQGGNEEQLNRDYGFTLSDLKNKD